MSEKYQKQKIAIFYDKKPTEILDSGIVFDLSDLEYYGSYTHVEEFIDLPSRVINKKSLLEWFVVDDLSLWWFIAPTVHAKFKEASLFVNRLENFVKNNDIEILKIVTGFDKIQLINQICSKNNISIKKSSKHYFSFVIKKFFKSFIKKTRFKSITNNKIKHRLEQYSTEPFTHNPNNDYVLFTSPGIYRRTTISDIGNLSKEEFFLQPIMNSCIDRKIPLACIDLDYTFKGTTNELNERLKTKFNWFPIEYVTSQFSEDFKIDYKLKIISNNIKELRRSNIQNFFKYNDISVWDYVKDTFDEVLFEPYLPTYLRLIVALEQFLQKNKPRMIIQVYESGPYAKCFQYIAQKLGIRTIGIQHGIIPSDYPDYMFKEIKEKHNFGNLIPDMTFVYGDYYKDLLTEKGTYPVNKVHTFGHPSYFQINKIKESLNIRKIKNNYGIKNEKIILVPLSFRLSYNQNNSDKILLDYLHKNLTEFNDVIILIRPHPGDLENLKILEKFLQGKNFKISNSTLIEDLFISDIVTVIVGSTVASESIIFNKPTLLVNVSNTQYSNIDQVHLKMIEYNVANLVSIGQLSSKINDILKDLPKSDKNEQRDYFLKDFFNLYEKPNFDFLENNDNNE